MLDVFLCHSGATRHIADRIASRLERCAEARVWLEELTSDSTVIDTWEGGLSSAAILLLLDRDAVPPQLNRETWQPVLDHFSQNAQPPIACVRVDSCPYPRLFERRNFYTWQAGELPVLRGIEQWIISLHAQQGRPAISPVRLPWFEGRDKELDSLWQRLVDNGGSALTLCSEDAAGKTALAQEFAARAASHFRDVLWIGCSDMSAAGITGELASQLGAVTPHTIADLMREHRLLIVFDDLRVPLPVEIPDGTRSSVLVTTRDSSVGAGQILRIEPTQAGPHPAPSDDIDRVLWQAISICRPHGVEISLPAMMAGVERNEANRSLERLVSSGLADRLDPSRVRLNAESRDTAQVEVDAEALRRKHAESVHAIFSAQLPEAESLISELVPALQFACENDWRIARELGQRASDFLRRRNRHGEAIEILKILRSAAKQRDDTHTVQLCEWELSWIDMGNDQVRQPIDATEQLTFSFV